MNINPKIDVVCPGIEKEVNFLANGVYQLPDNSTRFLVTSNILNTLTDYTTIKLIETVKTTIVHNKRAMTTIVLQKEI